RTIPSDGQSADGSSFLREAESFFQDRIHLEFNSTNASGEDAELMRRVFYDFRKMHPYVYSTALPPAFIEVLVRSQHPEGPAHFRKWGMGAKRQPWLGVSGQSRTTPLRCLRRELARIGIVDRHTHGRACFYRNTTARRAAIQLGW